LGIPAKKSADVFIRRRGGVVTTRRPSGGRGRKKSSTLKVRGGNSGRYKEEEVFPAKNKTAVACTIKTPIFSPKKEGGVTTRKETRKGRREREEKI